MKALTIQQPSASLVADGEKPVENRSWRTSYRGALAIHAGLGTRYLTRQELLEYPTGVIVATCRLIGVMDVALFAECLRTPTGHYCLRHNGWDIADVRKWLAHKYTEGPYAWVLSDVKKLDEPIPATGKRGLWDWEPGALTVGA